MKRKSVVWTEKAIESLDFFCEYIKKDSPAAAKRVKREIIFTAKGLAVNAEMYQLDEFFNDTSLNIRRFFRWSYRVVYQVYEKEVVILEVFHTSSSSEEE